MAPSPPASSGEPKTRPRDCGFAMIAIGFLLSLPQACLVVLIHSIPIEDRTGPLAHIVHDEFHPLDYVHGFSLALFAIGIFLILKEKDLEEP